MGETYFILMGDVVGSRRGDSREIARTLRELTKAANQACRPHLLSPLTVTLGDEFQGVATDFAGAVAVLFFLEETLLSPRANARLELRYVLHYGTIETPVNRKIAHGMLGAGLAHARERLTERARGKPKFTISLEHTTLTSWCSRLFTLVEGIQRGWRPRDFPLIAAMIREPRDQPVADAFDKDRSQIYKRRRTLRIEDYRIVRSLITDLASGTAPCPR